MQKFHVTDNFISIIQELDFELSKPLGSKHVGKMVELRLNDTETVKVTLARAADTAHIFSVLPQEMRKKEFVYMGDGTPSSHEKYMQTVVDWMYANIKDNVDFDRWIKDQNLRKFYDDFILKGLRTRDKVTEITGRIDGACWRSASQYNNKISISTDTFEVLDMAENEPSGQLKKWIFDGLFKADMGWDEALYLKDHAANFLESYVIDNNVEPWRTLFRTDQVRKAQMLEVLFGGGVRVCNNTVIPMVVTGSYMRGIKEPDEYYGIASNGIEALVMTKIKVADSGDLLKSVCYVNQANYYGYEEICDTVNFLTLGYDTVAKKPSEILWRTFMVDTRVAEKIIDKTEQSEDQLYKEVTISGELYAPLLVTEKNLSEFMEHFKKEGRLFIRSVKTCASASDGKGFCKACSNKVHYEESLYMYSDLVMNTVGIIASMLAITPIGQKTLSAKHLMSANIRPPKYQVIDLKTGEIMSDEELANRFKIKYTHCDKIEYIEIDGHKYTDLMLDDKTRRSTIAPYTINTFESSQSILLYRSFERDDAARFEVVSLNALTHDPKIDKDAWAHAIDHFYIGSDSKIHYRLFNISVGTQWSKLKELTKKKDTPESVLCDLDNIYSSNLGCSYEIEILSSGTFITNEGSRVDFRQPYTMNYSGMECDLRMETVGRNDYIVGDSLSASICKGKKTYRKCLTYPRFYNGKAIRNKMDIILRE